jgi:lysophospholipase L1-like esterase
MKTIKKILFSLFAYFSFGTTFLQAVDVYKVIPANDPNIVIKGAMYLTSNADSVIIDRHSNEFLTKASDYFSRSNSRTQSGVIISFKTSSPKLKVNFRVRVDGARSELRFAVYRDKLFIGYVTSLLLTMNAVADNKNATTWDIVLPYSYGVTFKSIELLENYSIETPDVDTQKKYIAIGNSITQGRGQSSVASEGTYPFILAKAMDWQLYNLGVSGSKITDMIADDTKPIKADVITILWGYNDWNNSKNIVADVIPRYKLLISKLRSYHPTATIYCIMPTTTTTLKPDNGGATASIDTLRNTERRAVNEFIDAGDKKLYVIEGGLLTTTADLNDAVHLNNNGAKHLANGLIDFIRKVETTGIQQNAIMDFENSKVKVSGKNALVYVGSIGATVSVYNSEGKMIFNRISKNLNEQFSFTEKGVYIINIKNESIKIVI